MTGGESTVGAASWAVLTTVGDELQAASVRIAIESTNWLIINVLLVPLAILCVPLLDLDDRENLP